MTNDTSSGEDVVGVRTRRVLVIAAAAGMLGGVLAPQWHAEGYAEEMGFEACATEEWVPSADEIAELNAEADDLAAYLTARGIGVTVETDDLGLRTAVWDYEDTSAMQVVDDFYWERYPPAAEDLALWNAEAVEQAAFMSARGIAVTVGTDRHGVRYVEWNYDDPHAIEVVDDFYWTKYPLPSEDIALINADADELAAHLGAQGIAHTVSEDRHGIRMTEWDYDNAAANAAVDAFYAAKYPPVEDEPETMCV